jgi:APA family basic amino acid/polyamine antiporter
MELLNEPCELRRSVGRSGFFSLAFGAIIGSGWIVVLGDWLKAAGPAGSALGFVAGGAVMILIAVCYGELAARSPTAGAEFLYTLQTFGRFPAFLVGWFLTLYVIAVCAFEAIALAWLLRTLLPGIALPQVYTIAGSPITLDALLIGLSASLVVASLHYRGAGSAIRFQNVVTYGFIAVCVLVICCGLLLGTRANLSPILSAPPGHSWISGSLATFATAAFFLNGWQSSLHAIEERRPDVSARTAIQYMIAAIGGAAVFYVAIILAASMASPWPTLIGKELPAAAAFRGLGARGILGTLVVIAGSISLTKTWSACAWIATRLLFAQSRHGLLPRRFARLEPKSRSPRYAVVFVTVLTILGMCLGRGAITPIVNMSSICAALSMILCLLVLLRRRQIDKSRPSFAVPGGTPLILCALLGAVLMVGIALVEPILNGDGKIPLEWLMLLGWGAIGMIIWFGTRPLRTGRD